MAWNEKMAGLPAKTSPWNGVGIDPFHIESIWNIPGSVKTSRMFASFVTVRRVVMGLMWFLLGNSKGILLGITMSTPTLTLEGNTLQTHG